MCDKQQNEASSDSMLRQAARPNAHEQRRRLLAVIDEYELDRDRFLDEAERWRLKAREASLKIERAREQLGQLP